MDWADGFERTRLRNEARDLADRRRHPESIRNEIALLQERLEEIDALKIGKGYSEKWLKQTIQDPSAYSHNLNALITEEHETEVTEITERLSRLRAIVVELDTTGTSEP